MNIIGNLMSLLKIKIISNFPEYSSKLLNGGFNFLLGNKNEYDEFISKMEQVADKIIIEAKNNEGLMFYGGEFKIDYSENLINVNIEMYFQDKLRKWFKKELNKQVEIDRFTDEAALRLKKIGTLTLEIREPV